MEQRANTAKLNLKLNELGKGGVFRGRKKKSQVFIILTNAVEGRI